MLRPRGGVCQVCVTNSNREEKSPRHTLASLARALLLRPSRRQKPRRLSDLPRVARHQEVSAAGNPLVGAGAAPGRGHPALSRREDRRCPPSRLRPLLPGAAKRPSKRRTDGTAVCLPSSPLNASPRARRSRFYSYRESRGSVKRSKLDTGQSVKSPTVYSRRIRSDCSTLA